MAFVIEMILLLIVLSIAFFLTKKAKRNNQRDAAISCIVNHHLKLSDLKQELLNLERKDYSGFLRMSISKREISGYQIHYDSYINEMKQNGTINTPQNRETAKSVLLSIQKLTDKLDLQERINAIIGEDIFPTSLEEKVVLPDFSNVVADQRLLDDILLDFEAFEKIYEKIYYQNENIDYEEATDVLKKLNTLSPYTHFYENHSLIIIEADDWGVFVQSVLNHLPEN